MKEQQPKPKRTQWTLRPRPLDPLIRDKVYEIVCPHFKVKPEGIALKNQKPDDGRYGRARHAIRWLLLRYKAGRVVDIAFEQKRDHTSICHTMNVVKNALKNKDYIYDDLLILDKIMQGWQGGQITAAKKDHPWKRKNNGLDRTRNPLVRTMKENVIEEVA